MRTNRDNITEMYFDWPPCTGPHTCSSPPSGGSDAPPTQLCPCQDAAQGAQSAPRCAHCKTGESRRTVFEFINLFADPPRPHWERTAATGNNSLALTLPSERKGAADGKKRGQVLIWKENQKPVISHQMVSYSAMHSQGIQGLRLYAVGQVVHFRQNVESSRSRAPDGLSALVFFFFFVSVCLCQRVQTQDPNIILTLWPCSAVLNGGQPPLHN